MLQAVKGFVFVFEDNFIGSSEDYATVGIFTSNQHHDDGKGFLVERVGRDIPKADRSETAEREVQRGDVSLSLSDVLLGNAESLSKTADPA